MKLAELSVEYRKSGELCRQRVKELRARLASEPMGAMEELRLRRDICLLSSMVRDAIATSRYLENYYKAGERHE